ncbi:histidine triad (HIT) nucleotide-binding protein, similarity with At5g48545 and yeast YDL125C (HNT1) [Nanoarchaeota archaeon]
MDNCVYCKIANKEIPSYTIYEDNDIISVFDIYPPSKGTFLVFPKLHIEDYTILDDDINQKMFTISKYIAFVLKNKLKFDGINIILYSGETKQSTKHIVISIIPRYKDDNINFYLKRFKEEPQSLEELKNYVTNELIKLSQSYLNQEKKEEKKEEKKIDYKSYEEWFKKRI